MLKVNEDELLLFSRYIKDLTGIVIDDDCDPVTKGPVLQDGARFPRHPVTSGDRHGGEIHMPDVIGVSGGDNPTGALCWRFGFRKWLFLKDATNRRRSEVQSRPGENLRQFDLAH